MDSQILNPNQPVFATLRVLSIAHRRLIEGSSKARQKTHRRLRWAQSKKFQIFSIFCNSLHTRFLAEPAEWTNHNPIQANAFESNKEAFLRLVEIAARRVGAWFISRYNIEV